MIVEKILEGIHELLAIHGIPQTVEPIIPLDSGSKCTPGNVGGADENLIKLAMMQNISLRMEGFSLIAVKSYVNHILQLMLYKIQR